MLLAKAADPLGAAQHARHRVRVRLGASARRSAIADGLGAAGTLHDHPLRRLIWAPTTRADKPQARRHRGQRRRRGAIRVIGCVRQPLPTSAGAADELRRLPRRRLAAGSRDYLETCETLPSDDETDEGTATFDDLEPGFYVVRYDRHVPEHDAAVRRGEAAVRQPTCASTCSSASTIDVKYHDRRLPASCPAQTHASAISEQVTLSCEDAADRAIPVQR